MSVRPRFFPCLRLGVPKIKISWISDNVRTLAIFLCDGNPKTDMEKSADARTLSAEILADCGNFVSLGLNFTQICGKRQSMLTPWRSMLALKKIWAKKTPLLSTSEMIQMGHMCKKWQEYNKKSTYWKHCSASATLRFIIKHFHSIDILNVTMVIGGGLLGFDWAN